MANLSAYLDFTVTLDFVQGKVVVKDTSTYPEGIAQGITSIVKVKQPDTITVEGNWETPDITHNGTGLTDAIIELRTQADNTPQQGTYAVTYEVDHPDYTPTTLKKSFQLSYERPEAVVREAFDVFTPNLSLEDLTDYNSSAFDAPTISRFWEVQVGTVGETSGTGATLDLALNSNYYDARYYISLTTTLTYQHSTYSYVTVKDRVFVDLETSANTPPTFTALLTYLKEIKERFDSLESDVKTTTARQEYEYAESILQHIKSRICKSDTVNLYPQIQDFLNVYYERVSSVYTNTNAPIATYNYDDVDCGIDGGVVNDPRISTTHINNWNEAYNSIPPDDLEFIVGITEGAPISGTDAFVSNALVNRRVRLSIGGQPVPSIASVGSYHFAKPKVSNTLTLTGYKWGIGDYVKIEFY